MRPDPAILAILFFLGGAAGQAGAQSPAPARPGAVPVQAGNPPATATQVTIPPHAGPNVIPAETKTRPGQNGSDATGLAPIREVPPPITPSTEASNLQPASGTISSNPYGLPITPNPAISSITPYLFHGYGYPTVGYLMPYGYRRSPYEGLGSPADFDRMRRLARLMNDLDQLVPGRAPSSSQVDRLRGDLDAVLYAKEKPSAPVVQKLAIDLARVVPVRNVPMLNTGQIARDLEVIMNAGRVSPVQIQDAISSVRHQLWHSGVSDRGILLIASDLRLLASGDAPARSGDGKPITYIP